MPRADIAVAPLVMIVMVMMMVVVAMMMIVTMVAVFAMRMTFVRMPGAVRVIVIVAACGAALMLFFVAVFTFRPVNVVFFVDWSGRGHLVPRVLLYQWRWRLPPGESCRSAARWLTGGGS